MLVDPSRIKNVPGRKTDVLDCQWLQQLHTYGLLSGSFRPEGEIRCLAVTCASEPCWWSMPPITSHAKALTQMNVKLQHGRNMEDRPDDHRSYRGRPRTESAEAAGCGPQDQGERGNHRPAPGMAGGAHL